jgi:two-component sensor histidine kinase
MRPWRFAVIASRRPTSATTLALVIHELATNSVKYGALSVDAGLLDVSCTASENEVAILWTERGGPPVAAPSTAGFGTRLIEPTIASKFRGSIHHDWSAQGLIVTLRLGKDRLAA